MVLDFSDVLELKKLSETQFNTKCHFHDCCGGQWFSTEEPVSREFEEFLKMYFEKKQCHVLISEDRCQFRMEKISD